MRLRMSRDRLLAFMNCNRLVCLLAVKRAWRGKIDTGSARRVSTAPRAHNDQKPYFITTPIFYPNSGSTIILHVSLSFTQRLPSPYQNFHVDPHIGHLYSTVIADILARYALLKSPSRPV